MKNLVKLLIVAIVTCMVLPVHSQTKIKKEDWRLAIQSYSFHKYPLMEALDKTQELGLKYIEVFPGHKLGGEFGDKVFNSDLDASEQKKIRKIAASKGIKIIATGVVVLNNPVDWDKQFRFAKNMGMEFITAEPALADWDLVEGLVKKYNIKLAVHNHPKPSDYWTPDNLLPAIQGRDSRIGSCADVGHWCREGLNSIDCLKKLDGKIISLHFKDIAARKEGEAEQHDVIWGAGVLNVKGMLEELKRQNFKGVFSIEYECNWNNSVPDIKQCIQYYNQVTTELFK